jgi:hypothetical protein
MKSFLLLFVVLFHGEAAAAELHLLEPTKLTLEGYQVPNNRDEYLRINDCGSTKYVESNAECWRYGAAVNFDLDFVRYDEWALYWRNNVHMAATQCCVRHVGWEFEWGVEASRHMDVFYHHHSQHLLDGDRPARRYPLINEYGVRFVFIERGRK